MDQWLASPVISLRRRIDAGFPITTSLEDTRQPPGTDPRITIAEFPRLNLIPLRHGKLLCGRQTDSTVQSPGSAHLPASLPWCITGHIRVQSCLGAQGMNDPTCQPPCVFTSRPPAKPLDGSATLHTFGQFQGVLPDPMSRERYSVSPARSRVAHSLLACAVTSNRRILALASCAPECVCSLTCSARLLPAVR